MNLQQLKTIVAISEHSSFLAASEALSLSHSAVSLHIKSLEEELKVKLVDRSQRPAVLTDRGIALVERAKSMMLLLEDISTIGQESTLVGSLKIGAVPSAMVNLLPPALAQLRAAHPKLQFRVQSDFSSNLVQKVRSREIDVAVATAPLAHVEGLQSHLITTEPLYVVAPLSTPGKSVESLLKEYPFIWFNRKTWAGQQIESHLIKRGINVRETMEVDSMEAIESLVRNGLGASIIPLRAGTKDFTSGIKVLPFGEPQLSRSLIMLERPNNPRTLLTDALKIELRKIAENYKSTIKEL